MTPPHARIALLAALLASLTGCLAARPPPAPTADQPPSTAPLPPPPVPQAVPDAVPKAEPKSRYGNPPFYDVFGKRYFVLSSSVAYVERGVASWYGPGFHKVRTSNGEFYDMYGMTAAHRTLPLPAYVRVTNLQNGRSVVVRVNDRGPFVGNRIIDLSYTAASKLDMLRNGTAMVEVRSLDTGTPLGPMTPIAPIAPMASAVASAPAPIAGTSAEAIPSDSTAVTLVSTAGAPGAAPPVQAALAAPADAVQPAAAKPVLFIQAGAFSDPANAERLATRLRGGSYGTIFIRNDRIAGRTLYRVRIGPVANVQAFDRIYAALEHDGVHDAHLALD